MTENEKKLQAENDRLRDEIAMLKKRVAEAAEVAMLRERIAEAMRYLSATDTLTPS